MKKLYSLLFLCFIMGMVQAQIQEPVKFKTELKTVSDTEVEIIFTGMVDDGWHVYSTELGDGGPISATFNVDNKSGIEVMGKLKPVGKEIAVFDKLFEMDVRYFENMAQFVQKLKLTGGKYTIEGYLEYGACNDENCLPPTEVPFKYSGEAKKKAVAATSAELLKVEEKNEKLVDTMTVVGAAVIGGADAPTTISVADKTALWKSVTEELKAFGEVHSQKDMSWIYIFVTGFLGGLLALFTPCVWPIIPMTVSFFLKRSKDKKRDSGCMDLWRFHCGDLCNARIGYYADIWCQRSECFVY